MSSSVHGRAAGAWWLTAALAALAGGLHVWLLRGAEQVGEAPHLPWLVLVALFAVAELVVVHLRSGREALSVSVSEGVLVLALFVATPTQAVSAAVLGGALVLGLQKRQPLVKLAFNMAHTWLWAVAAVALWRALVDGSDPHGVVGAAAALLAAVTAEVVAALSVACVIAVHGRQRPERPVALAPTLLAACANAAFALVVIDVLRVGWQGLLPVLVVGCFLALAQRAHLSLARRHGVLVELQGFLRRIGGGDLQLETAVRNVLEGVQEALQVERVALRLEGEHGGTWSIDRSGRITSPAVPAAPSAVSMTVLLPVSSGVAGELTVADPPGQQGGLEPADRTLLDALAGHAAMALHNARLTQRLRLQVVENAEQALRDHLTSLPNRLAYDRAAEQELASQRPSAVLLLDLDRFKEVNDTLGHAAGDEVLREVARRLQQRLPAVGCVARLGGDEFAVLLVDSDEVAAYEVAAEVRAVLLEPLEVAGLRLAVDVSIGVACSPQHGTDVPALMRHADVAMYDAKQARVGVCVYDPARDHYTADRLSLVTDLRAGIERGELVLAYQPKTSTVGRAVPGVEALVRWQSPTRGQVPPDQFIDVAERGGLIGPLTEWVVREALAQCRRWLDDGLELGVAVNISPRTLQDPEFSAWLDDQLAQSGVPPRLVTLEITEDGVMTDPERAVAVLEDLRALGVRLSLDDLGVGHSSLAHLQRLPLDEVKIDRSFVRGLADRTGDEAIVATLVQLGRQLGLTVVAEGVESEAAFDVLARLGAPVAQGYWMSRPLPADAVPAWVSAWCAPPLPIQRLGDAVPRG